MSFFIRAEPFGSAPVIITTHQSAVANAPRENNPRMYVFTNTGKLCVSNDGRRTVAVVSRTAVRKKQIRVFLQCFFAE